MNFLQRILLSKHDRNMLALAGQLTAERRQRMLNIEQRTDALTKKDIGDWHRAWQAAIDVENPRRGPLYDVYTNALIDDHLTGCISQRKGHTLQKPFVIIDREGKRNDELRELFESEWFTHFLDLALDARYWGHSLIEFGNVVESPQGKRYSYCRLVPRKHVCPERGVILRHTYDSLDSGVSYRTGDLSLWCIEVGEAHDLGLLLKVAPQCLAKKNMLAYWDVFGEIFGMPMRVATSPSQNQQEWDIIAGVLRDMGAAGWGIFPEGTSIDIKETSRGDAYNVYDRRVDRCNSEMSKAILGQTMTIDNGSSHSQSETHLEVFNNLCASDARTMGYIINDRLLPMMVRHGFPLEGCRFEWDDTLQFSASEQRELERLLLQEYEIDPQYFIDKYKVPIIGKRGGASLPETDLIRADDFFV